MKKAEVKFENITKKFNETVAVDNVSCNFEAGTLTTLLGPSGCGKTTSLRIIAGLERATNGKILVDNEDVTLLPATDRDVSMVFQSLSLIHISEPTRRTPISYAVFWAYMIGQFVTLVSHIAVSYTHLTLPTICSV